MRSRAIIVASLMSGALVSGGWLMQRGLRGSGSAYDSARLFDQVMTHVQEYYVDSLSTSQLYQKAVDGMLYELHDPHSVYLAGDRLRRLTESTSGRYAGLGVQIDVRDGWITVVTALPGTPAEHAGIQTGDRVIRVDGKDTHGWTPDEAQKELRGAPGSVAHLVIERPGVATQLPIDVTREEIHVRSVQHPTMLRDSVGYVDLTVFSESSADELQSAIESLRQKGARGLILDLRGNPGGLLDQGVGVSDLFLNPGQEIVSMKGRTPDANRDYADQEPQRWPSMPIVVLVDSGTASAAEIVSGALQDHDRAVLVGTTTYGKGSAQSLFRLENGALKLTTALWYTPSGRSINRPRPEGDDEDDDTSADSTTRKVYHTDDGRTVYGGGGITPDLAVTDSTDTRQELAFQRALGTSLPQFRDALAAYAISLRAQHAVSSPDFTVTPAMRDALWRSMQAHGVKMDRAAYDAAAPFVSRILGDQIARYALGSEGEFLREAHDDPDITVALDLLHGARTPAALLTRAEARAAAARKDSTGAK